MKKLTYIVVALTLIGSIMSCVPARKYEELNTKYKSCSEENENLKNSNKELEEKTTELTTSLEQLK